MLQSYVRKARFIKTKKDLRAALGSSLVERKVAIFQLFAIYSTKLSRLSQKDIPISNKIPTITIRFL